ncbi:MAG: DUF2855 family protein [Pseudomonadota bacterium]|nr:DUF2855 family protein [Pseudomonadota bacterium]
MTDTLRHPAPAPRDTVSGWDFTVDPAQPRRHRLRTLDRHPLRDGEARLATRLFALTANTMTYLAMGDDIGYWGFFPASDGSGRVPVWGFADVVESRSAALATGQRLYGFLPMAAEFTMRPGRDGGAALEDAMPHRQVLPPAYNWYQRPALDPSAASGDEEAQAIFRPLFIASFLLDDQIAEAGIGPETTVILTSASSKTACGLAWLLSGRPARPCVLGITSPGNRDYTAGTGLYDRVTTYDAPDIAGRGDAVLVDFAGDGDLVRSIHARLGGRLVRSIRVGATHRERWSTAPLVTEGVQPSWFFAPDRIRLRSREWGAAAFNERLARAQTGFIRAMRSTVSVVRLAGPEDLGEAWSALLAGAAPGGGAFVLGPLTPGQSVA